MEKEAQDNSNSGRINKWSIRVIYISVLLFFIVGVIGQILYLFREPNIQVANIIVTSIRSDASFLSRMDQDFIIEKTSKCISNRQNQEEYMTPYRAYVGWIGYSRENLEKGTIEVRNKCFKEYVLNAPTIAEMTARNNQLLHLAPYTKADLTALYTVSEQSRK